MGRLSKGAVVVGGAVLAAGVLRRALNPKPRYEAWERPPYVDFQNRILVLGGGFGGYTTAYTLCNLTHDRHDVGVMLISKENYFTFWPMVPAIISSDIDTRNVAQPLRRALIQVGASFRRASADSIDYERKVVTAEGQEFPYDHLVLSLGAEPAFFGIPGVEEHSFKMRGVSDAEAIRNRVIERFEEATLARGKVPESKLTFVVIGGGATGVETAAELHTLVHEALAPDYPNVDADRRVRIVILEGSSDILRELDPALRRAAHSRLVSRRIEVMTGVLAQEVTENCVKLKDGREIPTENVIWTAGGRPNANVKKLGLPLTQRDAVKVDQYLRVEDRPDVWTLGDCAAIPASENGKSVPPTAQAALQEGKAVAKNILAVIDGSEEDLTPFEYRPLGQMVELGSRFAVNEVMGVKFSGLLGALFWRAAYLVRIESPQSKARVAADWLLGLFFQPAVTEIRGERP
ncbi:MAG: NAD(P)/FAD-dependent oxidoreductase [Actinomycetota bacterium]|nr:NAD(P)/FAD-dependent oxidoreductase [Actinomycetota bacterium]